MDRKKLNEKFKSNTPILPNVKVIETWGLWDGDLFGICEIHAQRFFFIDLIESVWRYYQNGSTERLWRIYGVYDIDINIARKLFDKGNGRNSWGAEIEDISNCIGIFWEYEK